MAEIGEKIYLAPSKPYKLQLIQFSAVDKHSLCLTCSSPSKPQTQTRQIQDSGHLPRQFRRGLDPEKRTMSGDGGQEDGLTSRSGGGGEERGNSESVARGSAADPEVNAADAQAGMAS